MPYAPDVHIDQALTTLSLAYRNYGYVADRVLRPVPVDRRSNRYFIYGREAFKNRDSFVRPGGVAPEWERQMSTGAYNAERYAQRQLITDAERKVSDNPLMPDADATEILTDAVMNFREYKVLAMITNPAQVTQNAALSGTSQWSDYTNSTPLVNIRTGKVNVRLGALKEATDMTLSFEAAMTLADHPSIKDLIKYTDPNNIATSGLPNRVRGLNVNEAGAFIDSANDGQAPTFSTAFGKNALIHFTDPAGAGLKTISFGYIFEPPDDTTGVRGFATMKYRDDARHGDWIEVSTMLAAVLVAPLAGQLFTTVTT